MDKKEKFKEFMIANGGLIGDIRATAYYLHDVVCNQKYGNEEPYSMHLGLVADYVMKWLWKVCEYEHHIIPIIFGAYFHDAIEDARQTYNDILKLAEQFMTHYQAVIATELVYALTDEKGRNRAERGSEKHYEDIRNTKYAPFVKLCDRLVNAQYSANVGSRMYDVYKREMEHFVEKLGGDRYVPQELIDVIMNIKPEENE